MTATRREIEERVGDVARRQHGVVARVQLLDCGLSPTGIRHRVASGRLRVLHRGVYLVGPIMPSLGRCMAAVLACGSAAVVSHRSAALLWGFLTPPDGSGDVDITVDSGLKGGRPGIRVWRVVSLDESERTRLQAIPVTSPVRTLLDLATVVDLRKLERAVARAQTEGVISTDELVARIEQCRGKRGVPALRTVLTTAGGPALTRSEAEARFLALIREARLPAPEVNAALEGYEIDFLWRREGIAVEVDGYRWHSSRPRFESDRRRATQLAARGVSVIRLTWRQIAEDGLATAVQLGQALLRTQHRQSAPPSRREKGDHRGMRRRR